MKTSRIIYEFGADAVEFVPIRDGRTKAVWMVRVLIDGRIPLRFENPLKKTPRMDHAIGFLSQARKMERQP